MDYSSQRAVALLLALIVLLVLNSCWGKRGMNFLLIAALVLSCILTLYVALLPRNAWELFLLSAPTELCVLLSYLLARKHRPR